MKNNLFNKLYFLSLAFNLLMNIQIKAADTLAGPFGPFIVFVGPGANGQDSIHITFKPDSALVVCPKIGFVQTVKFVFKNKAGVPSTFLPSAVSSDWWYRDDDTTTDSTVVDHIFCEKDPYYNGNDPAQDGPASQQGSSAGLGNSSVPSTMSDKPHCPDANFPPGMEKACWEFETCAMCMSGANVGTIYGCIKWKYERTKGSGVWGKMIVSSNTVSATASPSFGPAKSKFDITHTTATVAKCPELDSVVACVNRLLNGLRLIPPYLTGPLFMKINHPTEVKEAGNGSKKGSFLPGVSLPNIPIGKTIAPNQFIFIPAGERVLLRRLNYIPSTDPQIPFQTAWNDMFAGSQEQVESGFCPEAQHGGTRVKNCGGITLCAAAPINAITSTGLVMFTTSINYQNSQVIFKNNALSVRPIRCIDVAHNLPVNQVNPGDSIIFSFPGQMPNCISTLNLKLLIQGYMNGVGNMTPVLSNQNEESKLGNCDSITIELHEAFPPFNTAFISKVVMNQNGEAICHFPQLSQPHFIAIKHRNALETWSANPVQFLQPEVYYDFTTNANQAFGQNQYQVSPGKWAFFSGDINQDANVDLADFAVIELANAQFEYGYKSEDLNGDGGVDLLDIAFIEPNISDFIFSQKPQ